MGGLIRTDTILDRIVSSKVKEVERKKSLPRPKPPTVRHSENPRRDFIAALRDGEKKGRAVIAEIKKASPSAGVIRDPFDPEAIALAYSGGGARCISVITDEEFFQGSLRFLMRVRKTVDLPILRKDFIIDPSQVEEAAWAGADAVLLIARILSDSLMRDLYARARDLLLAVLFEVHDEKDLERVQSLDPSPQLIGVNNRDLGDFSVSVERTVSLLPHFKEGVTVVSESGLSDAATLRRLSEKGVDAFLIGTALMKSDDPGRALGRLVFD